MHASTHSLSLPWAAATARVTHGRAEHGYIPRWKLRPTEGKVTLPGHGLPCADRQGAAALECRISRLGGSKKTNLRAEDSGKNSVNAPPPQGQKQRQVSGQRAEWAAQRIPCPMTHWASLSKAGVPEGAPTVERVRNARQDLRPTSCMAGMGGGVPQSLPLGKGQPVRASWLSPILGIKVTAQGAS